MKLSLAAYLGIALFLSLIGNGWQLYHAGGAKPRAEAAMAKSTVKADQQVAKADAKRDKRIDTIDQDTKADARKRVGDAERKTHERAAAIAQVPTSGSCRAPVGLPDLGPAVDQANAAAGH